MKRGLSIELRIGEQIQIGDDIVVTVEEKNGKTARLRVDAPADLRIRKKDVSATHLQIMKEQGVLK